MQADLGLVKHTLESFIRLRVKMSDYLLFTTTMKLLGCKHLATRSYGQFFTLLTTI